MLRKFVYVAFAILVFSAITGCAAEQPVTPPAETPATEAPAAETPATEAPAAESPAAGMPGEQLVQTKCKMCHDLSRVESAIYSKDQWEETVGRMQQQGLVVTDDERDAIIEYLTARDAAR